MDTDRYTNLIMGLAARTRERKLKWEPTVEPGVFQASFPGHTVKILQAEGQYQQPVMVLRIFNAEGVLVEEITPGHFREESRVMSETMEEMYENVRREAMGVDAAINDIIGALGYAPDSGIAPPTPEDKEDSIPF